MLQSNSKKTLITPSLYYAYYWYAVREYGEKEDFLKVLRKEKTEPTDIMLDGIAFENNIKNLCNKEETEGEETENQIANIVRGGFWQQRVKKELEDYLLYGICDVIKGDTIYDIKFCKQYSDGKYNDSIQHLVYMYCSGMRKFSYLIGSQSKKNEIYIEEHSWNDDSENELKSKIFEMISFIEGNKEFKKAFYDNWRVE